MEQVGPQKVCKFCTFNIPINAVKCDHCGEWVNSDAKIIASNQALILRYANIQPYWRFLFLCLISLGLYQFYWFYRCWKFVREYNGYPVSPFWRSLFSPIFSYFLFKEILNLAKEHGYSGSDNSGVYAALFILINLLWKLPPPYDSLGMLTFVPLAPVVGLLNFFWKKNIPDLKTKVGFSWGEIILIVICSILWLLYLYGSTVPMVQP